MRAKELPCESLWSTMTKAEFAEPVAAMTANREFARAVWAESACAPLVVEGPALERARRHFLSRAATLGHRRTREPALRVLAGGRTLSAECSGPTWQVALPIGTAEIRISSRVWVPAYMRPHENDARPLGVAIARLSLDGREVALDSPALTQGWHPPESEWRWTDGGGVLPVSGARVLAFDVAMVGEYWVRPSADDARPGSGAGQAGV